jgi:hypothetical protein
MVRRPEAQRRYKILLPLAAAGRLVQAQAKRPANIQRADMTRSLTEHSCAESNIIVTEKQLSEQRERSAIMEANAEIQGDPV